MKKTYQLAVISCIFLCGVLTFLLLTHHKARPKRTFISKSLPVVKVIKAKPVDYEIEISANGEVRPISIGKIVPEVKGKIVYISPNLKQGEIIKKGEVLIKLFDEDYKIALSQAIAALREANATLEQIKQEAKQAREEWNLIHPNIKIPPLAAKLPQLMAAKAKFEAAKAKVKEAKLNLKRTSIYAPYDAVVIKKNIDIHEYVNPGEVLAQIYPISEIEVHIPLTLSDTRWINIPGYTVARGKKGSNVELEFRMGNKKVCFHGQITRFHGEIDSNTRMLYAIASVKNPFYNLPPLLPNTYVNVKIKGRILKNVFVIPITAIFEDSYVLKVINNHIKKNKIKIARTLKDSAVVVNGINKDDFLVVTPMSGDVDGLEVRVIK
jgi:RND family efflux transporter MFP subunit